MTSYGTGVSLPIELGKFLVEPGGGYAYTEKGRSYLQTQIGLGTTAAAAVPTLVGTPGEVFTDENILDPANGFVMSLGGIGTESYLAGETVDAAWGKVDVTWNDTWRLAAGARWEDFSQLSVPVDQYEFDPDVRQDSADPCGDRGARHQRRRLLPGGGDHVDAQRLLGRALPAPLRLERDHRAARPARDLGRDLHRPDHRGARTRQPGARAG